MKFHEYHLKLPCSHGSDVFDLEVKPQKFAALEIQIITSVHGIFPENLSHVVRFASHPCGTAKPPLPPDPFETLLQDGFGACLHDLGTVTYDPGPPIWTHAKATKEKSMKPTIIYGIIILSYPIGYVPTSAIRYDEVFQNVGNQISYLYYEKRILTLCIIRRVYECTGFSMVRKYKILCNPNWRANFKIWAQFQKRSYFY